jgi:DNA-binding GntR family transcriptional regulator
MTDGQSRDKGASPFASLDRPTGAEPRTRAESVAAQIRSMIISGELAPGTRLRQLDIAEHFSVSTTPVREAFTALAREGFVRQDAHRGVEVFRPTLEDIRENYEIRLALEPLAAQLAAKQITDDELAQAERLMLEMEGVKDPRLGTGLNREFHLVIYRAAHRPLLLEMIERLRQAADAYVQLLVTKASQDYVDAVLLEHREIFSALAAHAPARAHKAMTKHLRRSLEQISDVI